MKNEWDWKRMKRNWFEGTLYVNTKEKWTVNYWYEHVSNNSHI